MKEEVVPEKNFSAENNFKIRSLEEKQRILKDRILLVGQNLIEFKEKTNETNIQLKKDLEEVKESLEKIKSFITNISREFSKFAQKDELNILIKQMKMFQPLKNLEKKFK